MREMKDSGIAWIGEVPAEWNLVQTKRFFSNTKKIVGTEVDKYDRLALTLNGVIKRSKDDNEGLQPEKFEGYQILCKNELVFKLIDLENVKTSRVGLSPYTGLVSPAYIVLTNDFEDNRFFYYWFMFMYYNEVFNHLGGEGVRSALNAKDILSLPVPDIRFDEQCRIADYLDRKCSQIDAIIARQQEVIEKLKAYKLSIITEAVTKGLNPDVPMKDSGVEWIGEIPEHWEMLKLKYASSILRGKFNHRPRNDPAYYDGIYPFVQTGDVARANKYIKKYSQTLNEKGYAVSKVFPANSICMTIAANIGDVAILTFDACFPDSVVGFVQSKNITWNYLYYVLTAMKQQFVRNAIISTQLNLNIEIIKEEFIPVAPLHIQEQISEFLDNKCLSIDRTISAKQFVIDKLADYKKSLIYEVVTGKKEV